MWILAIFIVFIIVSIYWSSERQKTLKETSIELKNSILSTDFQIDKSIIGYEGTPPPMTDDSVLQNLKDEELKIKALKIREKNLNNLYTKKHELFIDVKNQKLAYANYIHKTIKYFNFNEIIDCEIIEDNTTIMKGGIGRAVVGGMLAGGFGAVIGANTRGSSDIVKLFQIRFILNSIIQPIFVIEILSIDTKRNSDTYKSAFKFAQEVYATMFNIINLNKKDELVNV